MNPTSERVIATTTTGMIPAMKRGLSEVEARVKGHLKQMGFVWK